MKNPYIVINGNIYIRLTKSQAEALYNAGITITFKITNYNIDGSFYHRFYREEVVDDLKMDEVIDLADKLKTANTKERSTIINRFLSRCGIYDISWAAWTPMGVENGNYIFIGNSNDTTEFSEV